jgi:hypothetical protein
MTMTASTETAPAKLFLIRSRPGVDLVLRWFVLVAATVIAFYGTIESIVGSILRGLELSFIATIPILAAFAAVADRRRRRSAVNIHDRETDFIVGGIAATLAVIATTLLAPTLVGGFRMWRVDLLMMWLFIGAAGVLLFGTRRVLQYSWGWLTLGLIWPLPERLIRYVLGDGSLRWVGAIHVAVIIVLLVRGRRPAERRWVVAPAAALVVSAPFVLLDADRNAALTMIPPLVAILAGGLVWLIRDRPRLRPLERPAVANPWFAVVTLVALAVIAQLVIPPLPPLAEPNPIPRAGPSSAPGSLVPAGWRQLSRTDYPSQSRYFGLHSSWERYRMSAIGPDSGPQAVDAEGRKRVMIVDVLTTERPRTLDIFPVASTYPMGRFEISEPTRVDLGHGVEAQLYGAVDPRELLAWSMLTFTIELPAEQAVADPNVDGPARLAQRITLLLVDDHRPGAPFPEPSNALLDSMRAMLTAVLRGGSQVTIPEVKDSGLLVSAAERILSQRISGST